MVTTNDYLARRDAAWVGRVLRFLGLTVGVVQAEMSSAQKREAYRPYFLGFHRNTMGISMGFIKGSLGGETSVLRTFRMSGKELVKETVSQGKS